MSKPGKKASEPGKMVKVQGRRGVYQRASTQRKHKGRWDKCYYIRYRNAAGKQCVEKIGWDSENFNAAFAETARNERVKAIRHGWFLPRKRLEPTFGEIWEKYNDWLDGNKRRPQDDRSIYRNHLEKRLAHKALSQINPLDLEKMKSDLYDKGLAPATIKHVLGLVRAVINKAINWDLWEGQNPVKKVKLPSTRDNRRERYLKQDEAKELIAELEKVSATTRDIALMSLHTGMRSGEIFSLKWSHLDFENELVHVADSKSEIRKIPMSKQVKSMLECRQPGEREGLVFEARGGGPIRWVSSAFMRAVNKLGLNEGITDRRFKITFHTLRHTFASWLAIKGESMLTIMELLGHKNLDMTMRYSHLSPDVKKQAIRKIEAAFEESQSS